MLATTSRMVRNTSLQHSLDITARCSASSFGLIVTQCTKPYLIWTWMDCSHRTGCYRQSRGYVEGSGTSLIRVHLASKKVVSENIRNTSPLPIVRRSMDGKTGCFSTNWRVVRFAEGTLVTTTRKRGSFFLVTTSLGRL